MQISAPFVTIPKLGLTQPHKLSSSELKCLEPEQKLAAQKWGGGHAQQVEGTRRVETPVALRQKDPTVAGGLLKGSAVSLAGPRLDRPGQGGADGWRGPGPSHRGAAGERQMLLGSGERPGGREPVAPPRPQLCPVGREPATAHRLGERTHLKEFPSIGTKISWKKM